jgi:hypothetical protein
MHFWETSMGGAMMCAGVNGPITGKGANVFVLDDFVKGAEEANSRTMRDKAWDWYTSVAHSRLEPNGAFIIVATRWNHDDLIGRILEKEQENLQLVKEGDRHAVVEGWEVFCFPALAEPEAERHYAEYGIPVNNLRRGALTNDKSLAMSISELAATDLDPGWKDFLGRKRGEALCPERYNEHDLAKIRSISLSDWYALYQQRPGDEAEEGNVYHAFDEFVNCRRLVRDERMLLFVSLDFNVDPMTCVIGQYNKGMGLRQMDRCEVLEELVLPNSNTPAMMEKLIPTLKKYQCGYSLQVEVYGDAAGTQRSSQSKKTNWQLVAEYFQLAPDIHITMRRRHANPGILDRVNAVNTMLKSASGVSRLFVDDVMCPELVKDFRRVKFQTDPGGNSTGLLDKGDKNRTHISDALGYMVEFNFALKIRSGGHKGILQ